MKRPGYREAVEWLAGNDDCYWLAEIEPPFIASVAACMVRDLFEIEESKLHRDIVRALIKQHPTHDAVLAWRAAKLI